MSHKQEYNNVVISVTYVVTHSCKQYNGCHVFAVLEHNMSSEAVAAEDDDGSVHGNCISSRARPSLLSSEFL